MRGIFAGRDGSEIGLRIGGAELTQDLVARLWRSRSKQELSVRRVRRQLDRKRLVQTHGGKEVLSGGERGGVRARGDHLHHVGFGLRGAVFGALKRDAHMQIRWRHSTSEVTPRRAPPV